MSPFADWEPNELRRAIGLCAEQAAGRPADVEQAHARIHDWLTAFTADGQNAWYAAREADLTAPSGEADRTAASHEATALDAFSADLDVAWSVALGLPRPVAPLCCYALMRTSARGFAARLSPPLLAALVAQGVWSPEAAFAYVGRLPGDEQAGAATALAPWLPESMTQRVAAGTGDAQGASTAHPATGRPAAPAAHLPVLDADAADAAVAAALELDEDPRIRALLGLLPRLEGTSRDQAVAVLRGMLTGPAGEKWRWALTRALAPWLPPAEVRDLFVALVAGLSFGRISLHDVLAGLPDATVVTLPSGPLTPAAIAAQLPPDLLAPLVRANLADAATLRAGDDEKRWAQERFVREVAPKLPEAVLREALALAAPGEGWATTRTDLLAHLLPRLAAVGHPAEALRGIRERLHGRETADALERAAPHLGAGDLAEALDTVEERIAEREAGDRLRAISALAPFLDADQLRRALSLSGALGDEQAMTEALAEFALELTLLDLVDEAAATVGDIREPERRARAAAESAARVPEDERGALLRAGMAASAAITEPPRKADAIAALVPLHPPGERSAALAALRAALAEVDEVHRRVGALLTAAEGLPEAERTPLHRLAAEMVLAGHGAEEPPPLLPAERRWLRRFRRWLAPAVSRRVVGALLVAWAAADGRRGIESLAGFLARLPEDDRLPLLEQATTLAHTLPDVSLRARALVTLTPLLPPDHRTAMLLLCFDEAHDRRGEERISLLADLAARLPEEERRPVVRRMIQAIAYRDDADPRPTQDGGSTWRSTHLREFVAFGPSRLAGWLWWRPLRLLGRAWPARFPAFRRATPPLDQGQATAIYVFMLPRYDQHAEDRAHAAVEVARWLPEADRGPLLERALVAAREARYPAARSKALLEVARASPEDRREPLVGEALAAARAIERESAWPPAAQATLLAELAPLVSSDQREDLVAEALLALLGEDHDPGLPDALAEQLSEPLVRMTLAELDADGDTTWRAAGLLPILAALGHPAEALARIRALADAWKAASALGDCVSNLSEPWVREAITLADHLNDTQPGAADNALGRLLLRLGDLGHPEEAAARARADLGRNDWMPFVISQLLAPLPEDGRAELALDALRAVQRLSPSARERQVAMWSLAIGAMEAPPPALRAWLLGILKEQSRGPRSRLLHDLATLGPLIVSLDDADALREVALAVGDVCHWWPTDTGGQQPASWRPAGTAIRPSPTPAASDQVAPAER